MACTCSAEDPTALHLSLKLRAAIVQEVLSLSVEYEGVTDPARRARLERQAAALTALLNTAEPRR